MSIAPTTYEPVRVQFGDISVTDSYVLTPAGNYPPRGTTWTLINQTSVTESIPTWAIVLAILGALFFLLGLLFLLVKERKMSGAVQIVVQGPGLSYSTYLPVRSELAVFQISRNLDWVRYQVARL